MFSHTKNPLMDHYYGVTVCKLCETSMDILMHDLPGEFFKNRVFIIIIIVVIILLFSTLIVLGILIFLQCKEKGSILTT